MVCDAPTVAEIAAEAEISVPTLFSYFRAKEDVFFSDYEGAQEQARRYVDERPAGQSALDSLLEWGSRRRPALIEGDKGWLAAFTRILDGNDASVALHAACGFRVVGVRERLAQKRGVWRDVTLMERRTP